ncbi:MAG TPA: hypothetical protein PK657_12435 [Legionella sp.]|nr:hypothetical protein [Legionella sp.]
MMIFFSSKKNSSDEVMQPLDQFKRMILGKLWKMKEALHPHICDLPRPARQQIVAKDDFLYALMSEIKLNLKTPEDVLIYATHLESRYPLATETLNQIKNLPELQGSSGLGVANPGQSASPSS